MTRHQEITAQHLLTQPYGVARALRERRWAHVALAVEFATKEVPTDLAITDPALYRMLRDAVTTFHLRGGGALNLEKLRQLAATTPETTSG
jgi:hypothetical protein